MPISEVYLEDCMQGMARYPDKFFDLAIVDPPYGIGAGGKKFANGTSKRIKPYYKDDDWDVAPPSKDYFDELFRVSKNQIIWGANHFISCMPLNSSCWVVWDKGTGDNGYADCELAWGSFPGVVRKFFKSWVGANAKERQEPDRMHPTQKPIQLYEWLLDKYAQPGNKILDTHMGSQSSRIAAYLMGFDYYGWEIDAEYFEKGNKRFNLVTSQQQLF